MKQRQTTIYFFRHLFYLSLVRSLGEDLGASEVCKRVMAIVTGVCLEPPTLRLSLVGLTPLATQSSSFVLLARNNGSQWKASVSNVNVVSIWTLKLSSVSSSRWSRFSWASFQQQNLCKSTGCIETLFPTGLSSSGIAAVVFSCYYLSAAQF